MRARLTEGLRPCPCPSEGKEKGRPRGGPFQIRFSGSALTSFEPALRFVDHVNAAFATHNAAITVPVLERAERVANFHVLLHLSVWREPAPGCGQPDAPRAVRPVNFVVGDTGIEPVTPSMSTKCSTAELRAR